jgi:flagellar hook assembly protein FlgD
MVITSVDEPSALPLTYKLEQNYPNPFNASTLISFSLKSEGFAELSIFDLLGRRVKTLQSGVLPAGEHNFIWNGSDENNSVVASGVYFYRLQSADGKLTRRMLMMK